MEDYSSVIRDGIDGSFSSRRIVTFLAFLLCATAFLANLFFGMKIEEFIFNSMSYIAMAGLGATVAEKFSPAEKISIMDRDRYNYRQTYNPPVYPRRGTPLPRQEDPLI